MKKALAIIIATLKARNFVTSAIYSDGEGAIGKIKPQLIMLGIEVDNSGAGGHVSRIERNIRVIKERVRAHLSRRIPFALNILGLSMSILYCISRLNYQHSSTRPGGLTPRESFTGQRVAAEKDFRAAFGDSVTYTEPYTSNDMKSRIGQGIVYLPTGNRSGSLKILNLITGSIVTRDIVKIVPTTNATIKLMNDMAVLDGRFMPKMSAAAHDIIYNQSVNNANMPTFMPVKSPLRDTGALALIPDNPTPHGPIILADTPTTEAAEKPDIILRDERGRNVAPTVPLGLATQHDIVNSEKESLPTEPEHPPVYENPTVQQVPPVTDQQMEADTLIPTIHPDQPVEADTLIPTIHTQEPAGEEQQQSHQFRLPVRMSLRHSTRLQQRHSTEDQVLVTSGVTSGVTGVKVGLSVSAVESITAFLEKRKREGTADPSSNTSVRQALNSRGEEAEKVIMKELAQMDKLKV